MSVLWGLRNFVGDLWSNGGMPSTVDKRPFEVGKNLALSPGAVVFRSPVCEVIQYAPATDKVYERPLLFIPPQINKFYIMDLAPGRSFVEYAVKHGIPMFTISWRNPTPRDRDWGLDEYVTACKDAITAACEITGSPDCNVLGVCAGGITTSLTLGHLAAVGDKRVNAVTLLVTMLDTSLPSMTGMFATEDAIKAARDRSAEKGVLDGGDMARVFAWLRPNDLVWNYWVNNYLLGNDPAPFDILYWNADSTNLPAKLHAGFLDLFLRNPLANGGGEVSVLGTPIDLQRGEERFVSRRRHDRSHLRMARMLSRDADVRRTNRIRARLERPHPEPRKSAGQLQSPLLHRHRASPKIPTNGQRAQSRTKAPGGIIGSSG